MSAQKATKFKRFLFDVVKYGGNLPWMPDSWYLKLLFREKMKKKLNLANPQTFNEKLQWLKLYNRRPEYTDMVDKYKVRQIVADKIGEEYLIPLLGVWDSFDDIDFAKLPNQFVLKCNHDSASVFVCKDKSKFDPTVIRDDYLAALRKNYYVYSREWPYKNVARKIIAEKYMQDSSENDNCGITDYKFFCFNGIVDCVMVCLDRHLHDTKFYFFDREWQLKRLNPRGKSAPEKFTIPKPAAMDNMFEIAAELSKDLPFVRVDLYECDNKVYFGEFTFYPCGGFDSNLLPETDEYFGNLIKIGDETHREKKLKFVN